MGHGLHSKLLNYQKGRLWSPSSLLGIRALTKHEPALQITYFTVQVHFVWRMRENPWTPTKTNTDFEYLPVIKHGTRKSTIYQWFYKPKNICVENFELPCLINRRVYHGISFFLRFMFRLMTNIKGLEQSKFRLRFRLHKPWDIMGVSRVQAQNLSGQFKGKPWKTPKII